MLAEITAPDVVTWFFTAIGIAVSVIALRKSLQTDERDRGATIVIEPIWSEKHSTFTWIPRRETDDSRPAPDLFLVIAGTPTIADGLTLRPPTVAELNDKDLMGYNSHRIELKLQNVGRSAANDVQFHCTLIGTFLTRVGGGLEERTFEDETFILPTIPVQGSRYVEIRNLPSIPVTVEFDFVETSDKGQPVSLAGILEYEFHPRG
jgi:hypothetical protein